VTYGFGQLLDDAMVRTLADRVAPLWEGAGLTADAHAGIYRDCFLDPCPPGMRLGGPAPARVLQAIRPEIPGDPAEPLPEWAATLGGRTVVYLSLGTVPLFNQPEKFRPLLAGLADEDLDLVATVSDLYDPSALGSQPSNVHLERWLPLAPLFPRCDVVVCHAGSGTTLAALAAGLPLVLVPQGADQHVNADACERYGVARVLRGDAVTPSAVRDAVMAIIPPDSRERITALCLSDEIAAMPTATDVVRRLR
jgi:UDP:flavonoid glycosyltransferase YjiC (YdhE family)